MSKHSPGPWKRNMNVIEDADGNQIAEVLRTNIHGQGTDNGDLFAASYKMLATLKDLVKTFGSLADEQPGRWPEFEAAKDIIAELEGGRA